MDEIAQTDFLLFRFTSRSWNICRNFLLPLSVSSYQSSACFLVSWCPLMFRWENSPRAGRHPCRFVVGTGTRAEKSQYPAFWRVSSCGRGRKEPWGSTNQGCLAAPFIPVEKLLLRWPPPVPEKPGRSCFGQLLCQPCSLCLQKAERWLVWQPSLEHPEMLGGGQVLWRRHCGCGGDENSCAKGYERAGKTHAIILFLVKLYFVVSKGSLEVKYFLRSTCNTNLMCFGRRGKRIMVIWYKGCQDNMYIWKSQWNQCNGAALTLRFLKKRVF